MVALFFRMVMSPAGPSQRLRQQRSVSAGVTLKEGTGTPFPDVGKEKDGCSVDSRTLCPGKDTPVRELSLIGLSVSQIV